MGVKIAAAAFAAAGMVAGAANAQPPAAAPAMAKPAPEYSTAAASAEVAQPLATVMAKTGGYCAITEWINAPCVITSGKDGEFGAVRLIAGRITEVLVAKTATSYTYAQPLAPNSYHGTVEYIPTMAGNGTKILYTLFFDLSVNADQAAKDKDLATRQATVKRFVMAMVAQAGK